MSTAFNNLDEAFHREMPEISHKCGAAAVIVLIIGNRLYCANVGDSRAVLCRNAKAINLSRDHKAVCYIILLIYLGASWWGRASEEQWRHDIMWESHEQAGCYKSFWGFWVQNYGWWEWIGHQEEIYMLRPWDQTDRSGSLYRRFHSVSLRWSVWQIHFPRNCHLHKN